jgi:NitT/TauT family transport system ATP-binding protein
VLRLYDHEEHGVTIIHVTHDIDEAVYLADRVLVLSGRPGRIVGSVGVPLPRPRHQTATRSSPQFLSLRNELHRVIASLQE